MMQMTLRQLRRFESFIPRLEAHRSLRRATENSVHRMAEGSRRQTLSRWQREADGGQQAPSRVLSVDELKARSRIG